MTTAFTSRSALRHRPINPAATNEEQLPLRRATPTRRTSPQRVPVQTPAPRALRTAGTGYRMVLLGMGMTLMFLIVLAAQMLLGWIGTAVDDLRYGYPRTFQTDAFVGQEKTGQPSHFLAINLKGQIEIIELPGRDATRARIFMGPQLYGPGADLVPVTLQFVAARGSHTPEMHILFQHTQIVFRNEGGRLSQSLDTRNTANVCYKWACFTWARPLGKCPVSAINSANLQVL